MRVVIINWLSRSRTKVRLKCPSPFAACKIFEPFREEPTTLLAECGKNPDTAAITLGSVGTKLASVDVPVGIDIAWKVDCRTKRKLQVERERN